MSMIVKVCGLRTRDDVEAAVAAGADAIGFVFYPKSVRYVTPATAAQTARDIPSHVKRVAVMHHPSCEEWDIALRDFQPDVLQTDVADFEALEVATSVERWPVVREQDATGKLPDTFLYEGAKSGQGELVDWGKAAELARDCRLILAGGLNPDNVGAAIDAVRPAGVDASTGLERAPGQKSAALIQQFVKAARAAEERQ